MIKHLFSALVIANFGFCTPDCGDRIPVESSLPFDASEKVAYQNDQFVIFRHSLGQEIRYKVKRDSGREEGSQCDDCCTPVSYDFDQTNLIPDYPVFELGVNLTSYDSSLYSYSIQAGTSYFNLNIEDYYILVDSVQVGDSYFKEVYKMKNRNDYNQQGIYPDSVYYNFSEGFLKIIMSNKEYYEIQ